MTRSRALRPLLATPALAALAACAGLGHAPPLRDPALLSEAPAYPGAGCAVEAVPEALPAAEALVDTGALAAELATLRAEGALPAGHVLFSMAYAPDGANVRRAVIEHSVSPRLADSVQKLVFAHRRSLPPQEAEWGVRLRIDLDAEPRFRVGRREICAPEPRRQGLLTMAGWSDSPLPDPYFETSSAAGTVWVRVRLDELGRVTDARLERGVVRRWTTENMLLHYVRTLTFRPAVQDGRPVPGETSIQVRLPG
ncbi:MAG TPA: hypothetical protein VGR37_15915 [Longimicrobiaceae bacterium]|nr:hypothetical protein [Longimicrobiaceae bacterium]